MTYQLYHYGVNLKMQILKPNRKYKFEYEILDELNSIKSLIDISIYTKIVKRLKQDNHFTSLDSYLK